MDSDEAARAVFREFFGENFDIDAHGAPANAVLSPADAILPPANALLPPANALLPPANAIWWRSATAPFQPHLLSVLSGSFLLPPAASASSLPPVLWRMRRRLEKRR